jgi:predicted nucleic acid-binding protein
MILELAVSGQADVIITEDKDLLDISPFEGISVLSPTDFLESS